MSVVFRNANGLLLDACSLVDQGVQLCTSERKSASGKSYFKCCFKHECFQILKSHVRVKDYCTVTTNDSAVSDAVLQRSENNTSVDCKPSKKRKRNDLNQGEIDSLAFHHKIRFAILEGTKSLVDAGLSCGYLSEAKDAQEDPLPSQECNLAALCDMAKELPLVSEHGEDPVQFIGSEDGCSTTHLDLFTRITENCMDCAMEVTLMGENYIIPPRCAFLLSDFARMQPLLKRLPVPLLTSTGCVVVTWVTNRPSHLRFVRDELYPHWGVEVLAEWFWVKVTRSGEYVFPLDSPHKKPYEVLVLGRYRGSLRKTELPMEEQRVIVSVPSALHSHKPSLSEVLRPYVGADAQCLELFARSLQPGWTSWGNEVIKFQHVSYYTVEPTDKPTDEPTDEPTDKPTDTTT
ncbi:unnamed protein product [Coregonus sp. 'balchen']|nr:unnamed protein product [Coregonus sp. 'balchen']